MRKTLTALVLALVLALPVNGKGLPFKSVQPLQHLNSDGDLATHCTAYRVAERYLTDAHCVLENDGVTVTKAPLFIGGKPAKVIKVDLAHDLALLAGGVKAPNLTISIREPEAGTSLFFIGYPFGWKNPIYTAGWFAGVENFGAGQDYAIYNVAGAPGSSGSPVFALDGSVVGQVQITFCVGDYMGFCSVIGGATLPDLRAFVYGE